MSLRKIIYETDERKIEFGVAFQGATVSSLLKTKSGVEIPGAFSGSPFKATVTFVGQFPTTNYTVTLDPEISSNISFNLGVESKTISGFVINLGSSNISGLVRVGWQAVVIGEEA